jgi:parvulin-like peptidyl-prolyl isomerase
MTPKFTNFYRLGFIFIYSCLFISMISSCGAVTPTPTSAPATDTPLAPIPTFTAAIPPVSPTPVQLAARVNGEELSLAHYQAELKRYASQKDTELTLEDRQFVLDNLVDELLLDQGAKEAGFALDDAGLQARIDGLSNELGGPEALSTWLTAQGYSEEDFRQDLAGSIAAAWMRDQVAAGVPETAEQVHARQILLFSSQGAEDMLARLNSSSDFLTLAAEADPLTKGDLGWFPRGYLLDPKLEDAAFSLQPGETSPVIQTEAGFHILQVIERDPQRPLSPDARLALQTRALKDWLAARRQASQIEILIP